MTALGWSKLWELGEYPRGMAQFQFGNGQYEYGRWTLPDGTLGPWEVRHWSCRWVGADRGCYGMEGWVRSPVDIQESFPKEWAEKAMAYYGRLYGDFASAAGEGTE